MYAPQRRLNSIAIFHINISRCFSLYSYPTLWAIESASSRLPVCVCLCVRVRVRVRVFPYDREKQMN